MNSKLVLSVLVGCGLFVSAGAAEDPAKSRLLKQCESATGEVKSECQEVAKDILRKDAPTQERTDKSQDVTHSSPVMTSPQEAKREAKQKKPKPAPEPKSVPKRSE